MAEPQKPWTEAEKETGAHTGEPAGKAGEAMPMGTPTDDRAKTESAAARTEPDPKPTKP